jgi:hypothetical protein
MGACIEQGCGHAATHVPMICVPAVGHPQDAARAIKMLLGAEMCRRHVEKFTAPQVLDVPNEKGATLREVMPNIARLQAGAAALAPDCDRAWIEPVRIGSREYEILKRMGKS